MDTTEQIERFRAERQHLLDEGNTASAAAHAISGAWRAALREGRDIPEADQARRGQLNELANVMHRRYRELLPTIPVSRCPRTGELWNWAVDVINLDGWFWRHASSTRRIEALPLTWLAITGAMRVIEPVPPTNFLVEPGPGVPFVIPRILQHPEISAVISQLPIGPHTGWPITYFGSRSTGETMVNDWGSDEHYVYAPDGTWEGWREQTIYYKDMDFDLEPWLQSGDLYWIAPDDDTMTLRTGPQDCPYLDLTGPRANALIERGKLQYPRLRPTLEADRKRSLPHQYP